MKASAQHRSSTWAAAAYLWAHIALGASVLCWTAIYWRAYDEPRFFSYIVVAAIASTLKIRLPGLQGTVSVGFLFPLIGIVDLTIPDAVLIGLVCTLAQCFWRPQHRPVPIQLLFNASALAVTIYVSGFAYASAGALPEPIRLCILSAVYFAANTFSVAGIIALTEAKPLAGIMRQHRFFLPYYTAGTSLAWLIGTMPPAIQWELPIVCLPIVYVVHRSYQKHLLQIEQEKKHVEELNTLHLSTIEALALAIDAKDHTTHDHLQRVQLYALEVGKDLGLSTVELDALRAASVLHDIGKLAVPEYILTKPGKLTPEEFEKMKVHPVVGAEILERVPFPYPVVPIVRAHHEKWDGSGYPLGLAGEEIPIGARILAAVDCLDALASDRQYRRALPLDEAMAKVASESGTSFDPAVVDVLQKRYRELEAQAQTATSEARATLST